MKKFIAGYFLFIGAIALLYYTLTPLMMQWIYPPAE